MFATRRVFRDLRAFPLVYLSPISSISDLATQSHFTSEGMVSQQQVAADQKKLFHLLKEWKKKCDRDVRGENAVRQLNSLEYASLVFQGALAAVQKEGSRAWAALPL